jgi:hypothetical protein
MIGAGAIASGAQGCIFSPKLEQRGEYAVSGTNKTSASKVFTDLNVFLAEQQMLGRIAEVSNEGLLTVLGSDFPAPRGLGPANRQSALAHNPEPTSACAKAARPSPAYVLQMPRVDGDIQKLKRNSMPLKFLLKAYNALMRLRNAQIVHGDMGRRNIFFKGDSALIGDFGTSMFLGIHNPDENGLNTYINRMIGLGPALTAIRRLKFGLSLQDSITIEAHYALCIYALWPRKQEYIQGIAEGPIQLAIARGLFDYDCVRETIGTSNRGILITELRGRWTDGLVAIANKAVGAATQEEFWPTVQKVLLNSDIKLFIQASLKFIKMSDEKKEILLSEIVYNSNFTYFYRLLNVPIPNDILAMLPHETLTNQELLRLPRNQLTPHNLLRLPRNELMPEEWAVIPHGKLSTLNLMGLPSEQLTNENILRIPRSALSKEELIRLPHNQLTPKELLHIPVEQRTLTNRLRILKHTGGGTRRQNMRRVTRRRKN